MKESKFEKPKLEKEEEKMFNPDKDITDEDWKLMEQKLKDFRKEKDVESFASLASDMKIISSEKFSEKNITVQDWNKMQQTMTDFARRIVEGKYWWEIHLSQNLFRQMASMKIINPEKFDETRRSHLPEIEWSRTIERGLSHCREYQAWEDFAEMASNLKIIWPTTLTAFPVDMKKWITEDDKQKMINDKLEYCHKENKWGRFSSLAAKLRILYPEKFSELNVNETAWRGMRNSLKQCRKDEQKWRWSIGKLAADMKILAAEKVEVDEKEGLKVE